MKGDEKMIEAVTIKLPPSQLEKARALADAEGLGISEYIRALIDRDIEHHRLRFNALASIFGQVEALDKE